MNAERFRAVLRDARTERVGSQAALSARTAVGGQTPINIQTISDIERGKIIDPGILTITRLVQAMPGLTLAEFFARIEGAPSSSDGHSQNAQIPISAPAVAGEEGFPPPYPTSSEDARVIIRTLARYLREEQERADRADRQQGAVLGDVASELRDSLRARPRRPAGRKKTRRP